MGWSPAAAVNLSIKASWLAGTWVNDNGYVFAIDKNGKFTYKGEVTVTGKWIKNTYTIKFWLDETKTIPYGEELVYEYGDFVEFPMDPEDQDLIDAGINGKYFDMWDGETIDEIDKFVLHVWGIVEKYNCITGYSSKEELKQKIIRLSADYIGEHRQIEKWSIADSGGLFDEVRKELIESRRISNGNTGTNILTYNTDDSNNTVSGGVSIIKSKTDTSFSPNADNAVTCGRALAKWSDVVTYKVNGVEPSSLSLPSGNVSDVIDISSYISALDGTSNSYTVPANGWISIAVVGTAIAIVSSSWSDCRLRESSGNVRMLYPVLKNETLDISVTGTTLAYARFIPCQGNV